MTSFVLRSTSMLLASIVFLVTAIASASTSRNEAAVTTNNRQLPNHRGLGQTQPAAAWDANRAYIGGETATIGCVVYMAKWWTLGDVPNPDGHPWGPWKYAENAKDACDDYGNEGPATTTKSPATTTASMTTSTPTTKTQATTTETSISTRTPTTTISGPNQGLPKQPTDNLPREDNRLIAYVGNWQACPTPQQVAHYTHIVIGFAVTYQYNAAKNVCSQECTIIETPICGDAKKPDLVRQWQDAGKKVILSFGGAGMGGSWPGDMNDCWEYCFGKESYVVDQLTSIIKDRNFDGIDIDYEYFYHKPEAQTFLREVTTGMRNALPPGSIVTHAPMDPDLMPGSAYYNVLKDVSSSLDFIMPQYYNGYTRPAIDGFDGTGAGRVNSRTHYDFLVDDMFGGDATKIVFGFCINDCGGTGSNANPAQAVQVLSDLRTEHSCHGGAFFWVAAHDSAGTWSGAVDAELRKSRGCLSGGSGEVTLGPVRTIAAVITTTTSTASGPNQGLGPQRPADWMPGKVYVGGDKATYDGIIYKARYWTNGSNPPDPVSNPSGPWRYGEGRVRRLRGGKKRYSDDAEKWHLFASPHSHREEA